MPAAPTGTTHVVTTPGAVAPAIESTTIPGAAVTVPVDISTLNVNSISTWNSAINRIRNGGNGQTYTINVSGSFSAPTTTENLFGAVTGLTVTIQGSGTISTSVNGSLLRIGAGQTVILRDVTLRGRSGNDSSVVVVMSGGFFRMEGRASVTGNTSSSNGGVHVNGGTFIMQDSASVQGNARN
jgi:pectate lyase